ncbi:MAG: neuraminidase-like domain-containing protein [Anaerolineales bacterium]
MDLVNEVLEAAVFPWQFQIKARTEKEMYLPDQLDNRQISSGLKQQFEDKGHRLSGDARVWVDDKGTEWHIRDGGWIFEINLGFNDTLDVSASVAYQTIAKADELVANPEYLIAKVYDRLENQEVYPWNLPFSHWAETVRLFLKHLGLPRYELMEKFGPVKGREISVATEYLGMTQNQREIITDGKRNRQPWQYWGLKKKGNDFPDPDHPGRTVRFDWIESLASVPVFLERSGMDYEQLTELLNTKFINNGDSFEIQFPSLSDAETAISSACDLDRAQIPNLAAVHLDKMHRFVRLQRKTGWSIPELDQVIRVLEMVDLDEDLIVAARHLRQLQTDLHVPLDELLSWYANIDTMASTKESPSFYERLFLNKTVLRPVDEHFALNEERTELKVNDGLTIDDGYSTILAALRIDAEELDSILDVEFPPQGEAQLNLENLSRIHRIVSMSRALKISIHDFLSLRAMIGGNPFDRKEMAATQCFVETVHTVRASCFSIAELDYLLRHRYDETREHFVLTDEEIARVLADIGNGLRKIDDEFVVADDTTGELMGKRLAQFLEPTEVQQVIDALGKPAEGSTLQADDSKEGPGGKSKKVFPWLDEILETFEKTPKDFPSPESRFQAVLKRVNAYLSKTSSKTLVVQRLGDALHVDADVIDLVLNKRDKGEPPMVSQFLTLKSGGLSKDGAGGHWRGMVQTEKGGRYTFEPGKGDSIIKIGNREIQNEEEQITLDAEAGAFYTVELECDGVEEPPLIWQTPSAPETGQTVPSSKLVPATAIQTFRKLHKLSLLINKLGIGATELNYLVDHRANFQDFDWNKLPLEPTQDAPLFTQWQQLYNLFTFRDHYTQAETRLVDVLDAARQSTDAARGQLLALTGWDEQDMDELVGERGLDLTNDDYQGGGKFERLHQAFALLKRMGTSAEQLLAWATADPDFSLAQSLRQAVKSKYDDRQWLEVARPLEDTLREKRRAALVAYHMAKSGLREAHDLYQYHLLDVEMSPCMMTSRTKLAISSVQLFVKRCLMNLEAWRIASPQQALEWKQLWEWMKNYRVWEANRKVFLYPENWIEPELRRDKTPFFKELENELLSDEMTAKLAESAFLNYLNKLDAVARLEICGLYHEVETATPKGKGGITVDVLHVFGRTRGVPKVYYYRRRVHGAWTPWEQVNVDIQSDHLIPVVFNRRLYLFWPIFNDKTQVLKGKNDQSMWEYWEVQLAFSEYRQGMWSEKTISDQRLTWDPAPEGGGMDSKEGHPREPQDRSDLTFKTHIANEVVQILCARRRDGEDNAYTYLGGFRFTSDARVDTLSERDLEVFGKEYPVRSPVQKGNYEYMAVKAGGELSINIKGGVKVLTESDSPFTLIFPHQLPQTAWQNCFFYQDADRVFFVERAGSALRADSGFPVEQGDRADSVSFEAALSETSFPMEAPLYAAGVAPATAGVNGAGGKYRFEMAYHPLTREFMKILNRDGIDGLLRRSVQQLRREPLLFWAGDYESRWFEETNQEQVGRVFREHGITFSADPEVKKEEDDSDRWKICGDVILEGDKIEPGWTCNVERVPEGLSSYRDFVQQYAPSEDAVEQPYPA